jgi:hypothetical protein
VGPGLDIELQRCDEIQKLEPNGHREYFKYVQGHRESKKKEDITHTEQMNILADKLTKAALVLPHQEEYFPLPANSVDFTIGTS